MKRLLSILFFVPLFAAAQKDITHKVAAKESLSSIGRMYNINPRELAKYNKLDYNKGLSIGQIIKVPGKANAVADVVKTPAKAEPKPVKQEPKPIQALENNDEKGTPIYHVVAKKETLYHISITNGKVPVADIKRWNHLTGDGVNEGTKLIVGYEKSSGVTNQDVAKGEPVKQAPVVVVPEKPQPKPEPKMEEPKQIDNPVVKNDPVITRKVNFNGGYFKSSYQGGGSSEAATAAVFKSNSGWDDGKYYCLHNTAPQGSVVKITTADGKSVYAKVLDVIPDIKQNNGLTIRISNAAAAELGVGENKFDCTINYSK